ASASEACADADAHRPRIELDVALHGLARLADIRTTAQVARIGAGEPRRRDVHVHAHGPDGALGRGQTDMLAARVEILAADVGLVVAQAHERAEGVVGLAEVVLA